MYVSEVCHPIASNFIGKLIFFIKHILVPNYSQEGYFWKNETCNSKLLQKKIKFKNSFQNSSK